MGRKANYLVLPLLALLFLMPGLTAYLYYTHPEWRRGVTTNKGQLLKPAVFSPLDSRKKWALVLWSSAGCNKKCRRQLDKLARIRLALGRRLYEVDQWLVTDKSASLSPSLIISLAEKEIYIMRLEKKDREKFAVLKDNVSQLFIVNPDNYLILSYPAAFRSGDVFHDIKQLLS